MPAQYRLYVSWDDNGSFTGPHDEVTGQVLDGRSSLTVEYGRDQARAVAPPRVGELTGVLLDNRSGQYSPDNTSSPLFGKIEPGRDVLLTASYAGTVYPLFTGYADDFGLDPDRGARHVSMPCLDPLGRLRGVQVTTELKRGVRTGDAIGHVLDAVGWPSSLRDLDPGATWINNWWAENEDAYDACVKLLDSEGQPALLTVDTAGRIVFRDRHHRYTRGGSLTAQATWRSGGTIEPLLSAPTSYSTGFKEIINSVDYEVARYVPQAGAAQVVFAYGDRISLGVGETFSMTARGSTPFLNALTPVAGIDYTETLGTVSVTLSRTQGESTVISMTAIAGDAVVDNLQLRATPLVNTGPVQVHVEDAVSVATKGRRSGGEIRQPVWANQYDAQAIGEITVGRRSERLPTITVSMVGNGGPERLTEMLNRDLSDRVHVEESHTGLDSDCFIETIRHQIDEGGLRHVTTFGLEKAPAVVANPFTFDLAGAGFGQGQFQALGVVGHMFRFDTAGAGFGQGAFGY